MGEAAAKERNLFFQPKSNWNSVKLARYSIPFMMSVSVFKSADANDMTEIKNENSKK